MADHRDELALHPHRVFELADQRAQVAGHATKSGAQQVVALFRLDILAEIALGYRVRDAGHLLLIGDHLAERFGHLAKLVVGVHLDLLVHTSACEALCRGSYLTYGAGDAARQEEAE